MSSHLARNLARRPGHQQELLCPHFLIFVMGDRGPFPVRLGTEERLFFMIAVPRIAIPPNFLGEKLCLLARQVYNYHF